MSSNSNLNSAVTGSEFLWGFWYPALRGEQVTGHKLVRAMLLNVPLVLGRDAAGAPFALRDVCPHRAFPLSFGQFDGKAVECAYHGWQFEAHTGECLAIPSLTEAVTPIRQNLCRLDFCVAWNILPWFPVVPFIIHVFGPRFIRQDVEVIEKQALGLQYGDRMMLVDDADRQARWYFDLKSAYLESQRTGTPMRHPMVGPVTLRWRS